MEIKPLGKMPVARTKRWENTTEIYLGGNKL
jgi:hypothetical protein